MEQHRTIYTEGQVIEEYSRTFPAEIVETYERPMPGEKKEECVSADSNKWESNRKKSRRGLTIFLGCLAVLVVGAVVLTLYYGLPFQRQQNRPYDSQFDGYYHEEVTDEVYIPLYEADENVTMTTTSEHGEGLSAQEIYRRVNPAVVTVMAQVKGGSMVSVGTGVIFRADGYVMTNQHVVAGCDQCVILLENDTTFEARYVASDADNDLAILKMNVVGLPTVEFGDSDDLVVGDPVYAIGSPLRVEFRGTLTNGIVSAINQEVNMGDKTMSLIQTNAALNNGNSGGPLINQYGQVVGINVIKMYSQYSTVEGLGFAIPSSYMERIVNDLLTHGEVQPEPLIGISVMQIADRLEDDLWGLEIVSVTPDSAAGRAGVQVGDYLLKIDGNDTLTSQAVLKARRKHYVNDDMVLTIWRNGTTGEVTLHLIEEAKS